MPPKRLAAATVLLTALAAAPAAASAPAVPSDAAWRPWTRLLDADPYDVPAAAGRLAGVEPVSRCGGPATDLATAVARLGAATGAGGALAPGVTLAPDTTAYVALLAGCLAAHIPHLPAYDGDLGPAPGALRAEWLGTLADLAALARQAPPLAASPSAVMCLDPLCLVQVGGTGDDTYTQDAVLILDQGGSDTYANNAGGAYPDPDPANPSPIAAALVLDLGAGDDRYVPVATDLDTAPTNGAGLFGGVGVLVDQGGADHYCGLGGTMGAGRAGGGLLLDLAGDDTYESFSADSDTTDCPWNAGPRPGQTHKGNMGAGTLGGFGLLVDAGGDDTYLDHGVDGMGWGSAGGTGLLVDVSGTDTYTVHAATTACGTGFCGTPVVSGVSMGVGEVGGVGVLLEGGGSDTFGCLDSLIYGCMGASAGGVLGLFFDAGGDDDHTVAAMTATRAGAFGAAEPSRVPDLGGPEVTLPETDPGLAVFVDVAGADTYTAGTKGSAGWGWNALAVFLDLGGTDTYAIPGTPNVGVRRDGGRWLDGRVKSPVGDTQLADSGGGVGVDV